MTTRQIENEILSLIDASQEMDRSDLQGAVGALARKIAASFRPDDEPRQHAFGCVCATCSGAELTADND